VRLPKDARQSDHCNLILFFTFKNTLISQEYHIYHNIHHRHHIYHNIHHMHHICHNNHNRHHIYHNKTSHIDKFTRYSSTSLLVHPCSLESPQVHRQVHKFNNKHYSSSSTKLHKVRELK
jgi:hypothetical protein